MAQVIVDEKLGAEGSVTLKVEGGLLKLMVAHKSKGLEASLGAALTPDYFIDLLAAAIPGQLDDAVLNMLKAALKTV